MIQTILLLVGTLTGAGLLYLLLKRRQAGSAAPVILAVGASAAAWLLCLRLAPLGPAGKADSSALLCAALTVGIVLLVRQLCRGRFSLRQLGSFLPLLLVGASLSTYLAISL